MAHCLVKHKERFTCNNNKITTEKSGIFKFQMTMAMMMMMMATTTMAMVMHGASRTISNLQGLTHFMDVSVAHLVKESQNMAV